MNTKRKISLAIVGRPNVGKSTLFNILSCNEKAIVAPESGVTRDSRVTEGKLGDLTFDIIDTAGLELGEKGMAGKLNVLAKKSLEGADVLLFMIDGTMGATTEDKTLAKLLHKTGKPVILMVNKMDTKLAEEMFGDSYTLGFKSIVPLSAAHHEGLSELAEALEDLDVPEIEEIEEKQEKILKLAIVGRPNAGKSTLVNALLKEDRMITGSMAGLTRESVGTMWEYNNQVIELVDTAGIRKKAKVTNKLEKMSVSDAIKTIDKSHCVLLLLDSTCPFEKQDATIADYVLKEGKPLIILMNKWDIAEQKETLLKEMGYVLEKGLAQVKDTPILSISALNSKGLDKIMPEVVKMYNLWHTRLPTGQLNRFIDNVLMYNAPPVRSGRRIKVKYISQVSTCPPTFGVWCNVPKALPTSYLRFLSNQIRKEFKLVGVPIRMNVKGSDNPYSSKK
jgi:GTP-binding protein